MFSFNTDAVMAVSRQLDLCALRHEVYSANIANVDIAGYERLEVTEQTGADIAPSLIDANTFQVVNTHASVKLDQEMARVGKNALRYELLLMAYQRTSSIVSAAIKEGRGV